MVRGIEVCYLEPFVFVLAHSHTPEIRGSKPNFLCIGELMP